MRGNMFVLGFFSVDARAATALLYIQCDSWERNRALQRDFPHEVSNEEFLHLKNRLQKKGINLT